MIITIDGPSGAGKTAVAAAVAKELDLPYLPSGLLYRGAAWMLWQSGISLESEQAINAFIPKLALAVTDQGRIFSKGNDITEFLGEARVGSMAAVIARYPALRQYLTKLQQEFGRRRGCVTEGRSTAIEILPDADVKVWLTADIEVRLRRKQAMAESIEARDAVDKQRLLAPMGRAEGAIEIDSTHLSIEEVARKILTEYEQTRLA